jgi:hypothetical protein
VCTVTHAGHTHELPIFSNWKYSGITLPNERPIASRATDSYLYILFENSFICIDSNDKIIKEDLFEYKCWTSPLPYLGYGFHVTMHDNAHPSKTDIVIHSTTNMIENYTFDYHDLKIYDPNVPWEQDPVSLSPIWEGSFCGINNANKMLLVFYDSNIRNFIFYLFNVRIENGKILREIEKQFIIPQLVEPESRDLIINVVYDIFLVSNSRQGTFSIDKSGGINKISDWSYEIKPVFIDDKVYINNGHNSSLCSEDYGKTWQEKNFEFYGEILGEIQDTLYSTFQWYDSHPIEGLKKQYIIKTSADFIEKDTLQIGSIDTAHATIVLKIFNEKLYGISEDKLYSLDFKQ